MASTEQTENGSTKSPEPNPQTLITETIPEPEIPQEKAEETNPDSVKDEAVVTEAPIEKVTWPGWPGDCVFRLVVPVLKVGSIIGRKGELIKKMCEETRARVRVLDGPVTSPDRIVLISGKEEPEAALSPAMDAVIRVFKRVSGLQEGEGDVNAPGASAAAFCSIRFLVPSTQATSLIGKQGSLIKPIQERTGASVRVLSNDELPIYATSDERIVELQGEALKVLKALESVIGHLRKFLVDHSVLPLFEKNYNTPATQERQTEPWSDKLFSQYNTPAPQERQPEPWSDKLWSDRTMINTTSQPGLGIDYLPPTKRDSLFSERESRLDSQFPPPRLSLYGQDPGLSGIRSSGVGRAGGPIVTQIAQTIEMQIPLTYAEDIIGVQGANIAYIRRASGAILTVQESRGLPDEITVEIKGSSSQVQAAQQLIEDFMGNHKESLPSSYGKLDTGLGASSYSHLGSGSYPSSSYGASYGAQQYGDGYGSSGAGEYSRYRL